VLSIRTAAALEGFGYVNSAPHQSKTVSANHPLGQSRGWLSTKIHAAVDGRPLAILLTPGQSGDAPMMLPLLAAVRIPRPGGWAQLARYATVAKSPLVSDTSLNPVMYTALPLGLTASAFA
jgi:hypothetical protein